MLDYLNWGLSSLYLYVNAMSLIDIFLNVLDWMRPLLFFSFIQIFYFFCLLFFGLLLCDLFRVLVVKTALLQPKKKSQVKTVYHKPSSLLGKLIFFSMIMDCVFFNLGMFFLCNISTVVCFIFSLSIVQYVSIVLK